jgi:hypothetical protein
MIQERVARTHCITFAKSRDKRSQRRGKSILPNGPAPAQGAFFHLLRDNCLVLPEFPPGSVMCPPDNPSGRSSVFSPAHIGSIGDASIMTLGE